MSIMRETPRRRESDHVVIRQGGAEIACLGCGHVQPLALPMGVDAYIGLITAYGKAHADCPPPAGERAAA